MRIKNPFPLKLCFSSIAKQQATDKLHLLIDSNYWSVNEPLPNAHELSELLDCDLYITTQVTYRLVDAGIIIKGQDGRLYSSFLTK